MPLMSNLEQLKPWPVSTEQKMGLLKVSAVREGSDTSAIRECPNTGAYTDFSSWINYSLVLSSSRHTPLVTTQTEQSAVAKRELTSEALVHWRHRQEVRGRPLLNIAP